MRYTSNFHDDWLNIMRQGLTAHGIGFDGSIGEEELSLTFWNFVTRRIPRVPRTVHKASAFPSQVKEQAGLDVLLAKFAAGDDVNPHLSRGRLDAGDANFHDGLLNDWAIHHFHLGPNGKRTGDCLFAVVTDANVFCLDVLGHGKYGEIDLVQRIHDTWPQLIAPMKMTLLPTQTPPTAKEIMDARRAGISPLIQLADGTVYAPIGGGITTARVGGNVVSLSDYGFEYVSNWQKWFDGQTPKEDATAHGVTEPVAFTMMFDGNKFYAVDKVSESKVPLGVMPDFPEL